MLIGILQTGQSPDVLRNTLGDYPDLFHALLADQGFTFKTFHVEAMNFPEDVHDCEGWLITGSRHGAYEDHPFIAPLEAFIRAAYAAAVPIVGICFGHQIIAQALGGKVEKFAGGWAVGAQDYVLDGEAITLNAWHQDQVVERPADACVIGSNSFCENAALVYGDRALTVQAHPEFQDGFIRGLIENRSSTVPGALIDRAEARMGSNLANRVLATRIATFFKQPRG